MASITIVSLEVYVRIMILILTILSYIPKFKTSEKLTILHVHWTLHVYHINLATNKYLKTYYNNTIFCKKYIPSKRCSMSQSIKKFTRYKVGGTYTKKDVMTCGRVIIV